MKNLKHNSKIKKVLFCELTNKQKFWQWFGGQSVPFQGDYVGRLRKKSFWWDRCPHYNEIFWAKILNLGNRNSFFQYFSGSTHSSTTASSIYWSYSMVTTGERFAFSWRSSGPRNLWRLLNSPLIADGAVGAVIGRCCSCKPRSSSFIIRSASSIFFEQENKSRL